MTHQKDWPRDLDFISNELESVADKFEKDGLMDVLEEVLDAFITEAESLKQAYKNQLSQRDCDSFAKVVHNLKGTFGAIGQITLKETMAKQELLALNRQLNWLELQAGFAHFERQLDVLYEAVVQFRQRTSATPH